MELTLGRFGDRRLQKGGPFFWAAWSSAALARSGFVCLVGTVRARSACSASCVIRW